MRGLAAVAAGLAASALAGCGAGESPAVREVGYAQDGSLPAHVRAKRRFDVVVLAIPAIRHDLVLGVPESESPMPRLARLARECAVFENAAATSGWEGPSHASLLTALSPCGHGITTKIEESAQSAPLLPALVTLPEVLAAQGWTTSERDEIPASPCDGTRPSLCILSPRPDAPVPGEPRPDAAAVRSRHLERLRRIDRDLGAFLDRLHERDPGHESVVVVVGTCGETLEAARGGRLGRGGSVRDDVLHVPLVVRAHGVKPGRFPGSCSVMDVMPTILDLAGLPPVRGVGGRSLLPLTVSPQDAGRPVEARDAAGSLEFFALRTADVKVVFRRDTVTQTWTEEVFHLRADPREERPSAIRSMDALDGAVRREVEAVRTRLRGVQRLAEDAAMGGYDVRGISGC